MVEAPLEPPGMITSDENGKTFSPKLYCNLFLRDHPSYFVLAGKGHVLTAIILMHFERITKNCK